MAVQEGTSRRGRHRVLRGLGSRFRALFWGQAVSQVGDYIAYLTVPLFVIQLTDSNVDLALTYALEILPGIAFGLIGGVLLDRLPMRGVMIAADLARAAAFFGLAVLALTPRPSAIAVVFLISFLIGTFSSVFQNGLAALIPALVSKDQLNLANARVTTSQQVALVLGPLVAGAMAGTFGLAPGFVVNGLTFVLSAVSIWLVGSVPIRIGAEERGNFLEEALHGLRYLWSEPRLRASTIAAASANAAVGFLESTFVVLGTEVVGADAAGIGVMLMALGLGGITGALIAPRLSRLLGLGRTMTLGMVVFGLAFWVAVHSTYGFGLLVVMFVMFIGISLVNVPLATIRQIYTPNAMLGRVITAARTIGWSTLPIGALAGSAVADGASYESVARATPLILIATGLWLVLTPIWSDTFGSPIGKRLARNGQRSTAHSPQQNP
jgi:predicted MFS family arabinose efflux permease